MGLSRKIGKFTKTKFDPFILLVLISVMLLPAFSSSLPRRSEKNTSEVDYLPASEFIFIFISLFLSSLFSPTSRSITLSSPTTSNIYVHPLFFSLLFFSFAWLSFFIGSFLGSRDASHGGGGSPWHKAYIRCLGPTPSTTTTTTIASWNSSLGVINFYELYTPCRVSSLSLTPLLI